MKVTFYGVGYVGLVQAAVFADAGHDVCCVDMVECCVTVVVSGVVLCR